VEDFRELPFGEHFVLLFKASQVYKIYMCSILSQKLSIDDGQNKNRLF